MIPLENVYFVMHACKGKLYRCVLYFTDIFPN